MQSGSICDSVLFGRIQFPSKRFMPILVVAIVFCVRFLDVGAPVSSIARSFLILYVFLGVAGQSSMVAR